MDSWARRVHTGMADRVSVASSAPPEWQFSSSERHTCWPAASTYGFIGAR